MFGENFTTIYCVSKEKELCTNLKKIHFKVLELIKFDFLSRTEFILIFLQAATLIFISLPFFSEEARVYALISFSSLSLIKIIIYCFRRTSSNYSMKYLYMLCMYMIQLVLIIFIGLLLIRFEIPSILTNILSIAFLVILSIIGFFNLTIVIKYIFYRKLKYVFPTHADSENFTNLKLKNLAPFMSIEKQGAYLILHYGINITIYGFYLYICLLAFKSVDFSTWPLFNHVHRYVQNWSFINLSNLIGLSSIFLAILTICIPIQRKILSEAEGKYTSAFNFLNRE